MKNLLKLIDNTAATLHRTTNKIDNVLQQQKQKLATKVFTDNTYLQNYIKHFYDKFDNTFIEENNELVYLNEFDFTQIPENLKENLKEYMSDYHELYYYCDDYNEGFTISSFDDIFITYEDEIYADFIRHNDRPCKLSFHSDLELFLKLELIQQHYGIYPNIVHTGYYGDYQGDYKTPEDYRFLKTAMHHDEKKLIRLLNSMIELYDSDYIDHYYDNSLIEQFTPDFIKKIDNNLSVSIEEYNLDDNFELRIMYHIPTMLTHEQLEKLNIKEYVHNTKYNYTLITIRANIKEYLQDELNKENNKAA